MKQKEPSASAADGSPARLQWHPAFSCAVQIEFTEDMPMLAVSTEYQLTRKPFIMDMLVVKKTADYKCKNEIAAFFREHNIIEYKSPKESYGINDFYKTLAYAGIYQSNTKKEAEIDPDSITVTVVCGSFPRTVIRRLKNMYGMEFQTVEPGIYRSGQNILFPVQFVINTKLEPEKFKWLSRLRDNLTAEKDVEILAREYKGKETDPLYETTMDVIMRANSKAYEEAKNMCQALRELFADELEEQKLEGRNEGRTMGKLEGQNLINRLNQTLLEQGLFDELKRATLNPAYQQELLQRYELI